MQINKFILLIIGFLIISIIFIVKTVPLIPNKIWFAIFLKDNQKVIDFVNKNNQNIFAQRNDQTLLYLAFNARNYALAEFLIMRGADINFSTNDDVTAFVIIFFYLLTRKLNENAVLKYLKLLIDNKADLKNILDGELINLDEVMKYKKIANFLLSQNELSNLLQRKTRKRVINGKKFNLLKNY